MFAFNLMCKETNTMKKIIFLSLVVIAFTSCNRQAERSTSTGWNYNDSEWGGFIKAVSESQTIGPNLVPIEGGSFTMGQVEEDVMFDYNNLPKRVTVNSFLIDETEVSNLHYREYVYWVSRVMGDEYPEVVDMVRPDTLVWRDELSYNEPQVENYFSYPAYNEYPVVGVSWEQARDFAKWRSDRVNEMLLARRGIIALETDQSAEQNFNTDAYLLGIYEAQDGPTPLENKNPNSDEATRRVSRDDGIILPEYRLPTEAEWEYAALGMPGNLIEGTEINKERKLYPWEGTTVRADEGRHRGKFMANFKRGRGDNMGVAGALNDNAAYPSNIYAYSPNPFGLFGMAGNVSEWVQDVYRPLSPLDVEDFSPFRGNVFTRKAVDESGEYMVDSLGQIVERVETQEDIEGRTNYLEGDARDYRDGDELSNATYGYGETTLINNESRVYKGASWNDRAYFLSPGTRRFFQQERASSEIGFRCAMDMIGGPEGNVILGKESRKERRRVRKNRRNRNKSLQDNFKIKQGGKKNNSGSDSSGSGNSEDDSTTIP